MYQAIMLSLFILCCNSSITSKASGTAPTLSEQTLFNGGSLGAGYILGAEGPFPTIDMMMLTQLALTHPGYFQLDQKPLLPAELTLPLWSGFLAGRWKRVKDIVAKI